MAEYIERDKIFSVWRSIPAPASVTSLAAAISQTPAADVAPVVHGWWIHNPDYESWAEKYICSVCNRNALTDGDYRHKLSNYCPNCGAKMDGEERDKK